MPSYRITYQTTVSVSVTLDLPDDNEAFDEPDSGRLVEEHFNSIDFAHGPNGLVADATVDGMAPTQIERRDGDDWVALPGYSS